MFSSGIKFFDSSWHHFRLPQSLRVFFPHIYVPSIPNVPLFLIATLKVCPCAQGSERNAHKRFRRRCICAHGLMPSERTRAIHTRRGIPGCIDGDVHVILFSPPPPLYIHKSLSLILYLNVV